MSGPKAGRRWARFTAAGTAGFAVQMSVLAALTHVAGLHYVAATLLSVEAAILCNFAWHERWTWRDRPAATTGERWRRLMRFNALTGLTSLAGTTALTAAFVEAGGLSPMAANALAVITLGLVNFAGAETLVFRVAAAVALVAAGSPAGAATLQSKTVYDFSRYAAAVEARTARELRTDGPFLAIDSQDPRRVAEARASLRRGEVLVTLGAAHVGASGDIEIAGGIINHWRGTIFIPNVTLDQVLRTLKTPGDGRHAQEDVVRSRVLEQHGDTLRVYARLKRTTVVTVVYDTEHDVRYRLLAPGRAASTSVATRIAEIEAADTPAERALPEGDDHGFMWRLNSYWRYEQADGGVLVELESLTLSRDIPFVFKPLVRPLVDRIARESMSRTLESVRARFISRAGL